LYSQEQLYEYANGQYSEQFAALKDTEGFKECLLLVVFVDGEGKEWYPQALPGEKVPAGVSEPAGQKFLNNLKAASNSKSPYYKESFSEKLAWVVNVFANSAVVDAPLSNAQGKVQSALVNNTTVEIKEADKTAINDKLQTLTDDLREQTRLSEVLRFQINDIDSVKLKAGEEDELTALVSRLRGLEKINKSCSLVTRALEGGKGMGAIYLVDRAAAALDSVSDSIPEANALAARLSEVKYELEDIAATVSSLCEIDGDPTVMLDKAESRLDAILKLKRKYGSTVEEIIAFRDDAKAKLEFIENADDIRVDIENELKEAESEARKAASALTESRRRAAHGLTKKVCESLAFLDMPKVRFEASLEPLDDFSRSGCDNVEFLISANPGEPLLPMAKIASGGELARIMLSLKNEINICDGIDTVVFDEIDTGISGKTSRKVGMKLKEIGRSAQVICVTHSAQIASLAHNHLFVSKTENNGRTESAVRALDSGERVGEIARILGGIEITKVQREAAEELLRDGTDYK
jgi:DNA repair protein RecN (Recombination protein N)